jgi:NAD(P)-dependent dehydrogenase (short-subunit alcohol dehydrogenase family)
MGTTRVPLEPTNYSWQQIVDRRQRYANGELERNRRNEGSAICDRLRGSGMRDRGSGRIVTISSMAGRMGNADKVAYTAAKAGLQGMIRTVAIENCALGITANCVLPGFVATPRLLAMPESNRNRILGAIPSGRYGRPDEVTDLVTFLARDDAGYITAQEIGIDGGLELNTLSIVGSKR